MEGTKVWMTKVSDDARGREKTCTIITVGRFIEYLKALSMGWLGNLNDMNKLVLQVADTMYMATRLDNTQHYVLSILVKLSGDAKANATETCLYLVEP